MLTAVLSVPSIRLLLSSERPSPPSRGLACRKSGASTSRKPSPARYRNTNASIPQIDSLRKNARTLSANSRTTSAALARAAADRAGRQHEAVIERERRHHERAHEQRPRPRGVRGHAASRSSAPATNTTAAVAKIRPGVPGRALHADPRGLAARIERGHVDAVDADVLRRRGERDHPEDRDDDARSSSRFRARARSRRAAPRSANSVASTKNFFVFAMSRNAAQSGFSDHAIPIVARRERDLGVGVAEVLEHRARDPDHHRERHAFREVRRRNPPARRRRCDSWIALAKSDVVNCAASLARRVWHPTSPASSACRRRRARRPLRVIDRGYRACWVAHSSAVLVSVCHRCCWPGAACRAACGGALQRRERIGRRASSSSDRADDHRPAAGAAGAGPRVRLRIAPSFVSGSDTD